VNRHPVKPRYCVDGGAHTWQDGTYPAWMHGGGNYARRCGVCGYVEFADENEKHRYTILSGYVLGDDIDATDPVHSRLDYVPIDSDDAYDVMQRLPGDHRWIRFTQGHDKQNHDKTHVTTFSWRLDGLLHQGPKCIDCGYVHCLLCELSEPEGYQVAQKAATRVFYLYRYDDVSGVSGTGLVAEGVLFSTGKVALTWRTGLSSVTVYDSLKIAKDIHTHKGKSDFFWQEDCKIVWGADPVPDLSKPITDEQIALLSRTTPEERSW
jgi:hypothetical protein